MSLYKRVFPKWSEIRGQIEVPNVVRDADGDAMMED